MLYVKNFIGLQRRCKNIYTILQNLLWLYCFVVTASITKNPDNLTVVYENDNVTLSCEATASGPITYQWRRSNRVIGGNSTTLTIPSVTQDDEDEYYCTASYGVYVNGTSHVAESERAKVVVFGMNICICIMYSSSFMLICCIYTNIDKVELVVYTSLIYCIHTNLHIYNKT